MDTYKILSSIYDSLNPKENIFAQRPFFDRLIRQYGVKSCLDCACGTGWHLFMLAEMGLACSGSDLSPEMLALAGDHLKGKSVVLKQADYRNLPETWGQSFDMIVCLSTSLPYMMNDHEVAAALRSMYACLNPGGILVISSGISDALLDNKPRLIPASVLENEAFYFFMEYPDSETVVFNILYVKKTEPSFEHQFVSTRYNAMRQAVLERGFAQTAFQTVHYYGDHDFSPYSRQSSGRLVAVAEKSS